MIRVKYFARRELSPILRWNMDALIEAVRRGKLNPEFLRVVGGRLLGEEDTWCELLARGRPDETFESIERHVHRRGAE
eukprot:1631003-Pyramimonas_sp.AAC.1